MQRIALCGGGFTVGDYAVGTLVVRGFVMGGCAGGGCVLGGGCALGGVFSLGIGLRWGKYGGKGWFWAWFVICCHSLLDHRCAAYYTTNGAKKQENYA